MPLFPKTRYVDIRTRVDAHPECSYFAFMGERSNGKTYSALDKCIEDFCQKGWESVYLRRFHEDITSTEMCDLFEAHEKNDRILTLSNGAFSSVAFSRSRFYLANKTASGDIVKSDRPFCRAMCLTNYQRYQGKPYPYTNTIVFDEFMTRKGYIPGEFGMFRSIISSVFRDYRPEAKVIMLANTVNKSCPYFTEMGLTHVWEMEQGSSEIYTYGKSSLSIYVEYLESSAKHGGKETDRFFAFDNPSVNMITTGAWEMAVYPRLPDGYEPNRSEIVQWFFIRYEQWLIAGRIVSSTRGDFIYFTPWSSTLKDDDIVYTDTPDIRSSWRMALTKQSDKLSHIICQLIRENRCFFANNETGEVLRNYLKWSQTQSIVNL